MIVVVVFDPGLHPRTIAPVLRAVVCREATPIAIPTTPRHRAKRQSGQPDRSGRKVARLPFDVRMSIEYLFMAILGGSGHILLPQAETTVCFGSGPLHCASVLRRAHFLSCLADHQWD
jgi:hypothetical protein